MQLTCYWDIFFRSRIISISTNGQRQTILRPASGRTDEKPSLGSGSDTYMEEYLIF
jgi:hypothetical protein